MPDTGSDIDNSLQLTKESSKNTVMQVATDIRWRATAGAGSHGIAPLAVYTMAQVSSRDSRESCYTVIRGSVYNLTDFIAEHPGGVEAVSSICGVDGTSTFINKHGLNPQIVRGLKALKIGTLVE